ncbi:hypothetical protein NH8B_2280 [Pseudogulbenkiania sp. NH8B]|uniref:hypothetical protein n=1 Tax=Pseudogulbenkiania sp. (strain NH8B) TaxID=748280 RepID=UPI0002279DF2|nr:hypothetical protein [Pseudogulbenkiania sp. NH8B]BAK77094.1 hypothetical protein NH8B_2280 [Pseudogulbenkiania sp. NH8B]
MRTILLAALCLIVESTAATEVPGILRCEHERTKAVSYTSGACPAGTLAVKRPEQGGFVGNGNGSERGVVTVCRMDSRFDSFRYVVDGGCPFGSSGVATFSNATIEEARQQFAATWHAAVEEPHRRKAVTPPVRRKLTKQTIADCHALRQQRDKVQARLNNNKAYQDDLQRLRDAQDAVAREGCRAFGD